MFGAAVVGLNSDTDPSNLENGFTAQPIVADITGTDLTQELETDAVSTEEKVREYFADVPILVDVARCESQYRQFGSNGQPLRGIVNKSDVGVMQINEYYHLETAQKLGYNLETLKGNLDYARNLYERQGTAPWVHSSPCWGKSREVALLH